MFPNFVIIGAQKAATSYLHQCLNDHPEIYIYPEEIPFFESPDYDRFKINDLKKLFSEKNELRLGIKRPNYLCKPEVPARIIKHLPNAKLIVILRDPVERAISAYFHLIKYGMLPSIRIERGLKRIIIDPTFVSKFPRAREIIEFGFYYKHLKAYNHYKHCNHLMFHLHEEILMNQLESIRNTYKYLSVEENFTPNSINSKPKASIYNLVRLRFVSMTNRYKFSYNKERTRLVKRKMNRKEKVFVRLIEKIDKRIFEKVLPNNKPQISEDLHKLLLDIYIRDIHCLENYLERDLSHWYR